MLYLHALRAARPRQLRARALRPLARRRFPDGAPPRPASGVAGAEELWRSPAFEASSPPDPSTWLGRFHRQYGDDVLAAARAGDVEEARRLVATWIEAHPPRRGDAWHPYPLSTRVGNWIAALTLEPALESPALSASLWRQLRRLEANVEDDILGNHVIRNARAFVLGGAAFGAPELMRRGIDLLRRELPEQVLQDGGHYERSPAYHLVVLRDLLEIQAASPHSWIAETIGRMRVFAAALERPDGAPALFNDGTVDAPRLDLPEPPAGLAVFSDSGFVVARDGPMWLAFRCGPAAPAYLPAHAHADALSFQLWWRGRPVVVDPGAYTYEPGVDRAWFRSTRAHSTVAVGGRDQFRVWGAFRSGPLPKVSLRYARDGAVEASVVLRGRIRHVRRIEWESEAGTVWVHDQFEGKGRRRLESRVVWAPELPKVELEATSVKTVVEQSWLSERFGERTPTTAAAMLTERELPTSLSFRIRCLE
jgi:Heparinase II/III-like protein/Heparinase II/III N-terminus